MSRKIVALATFGAGCFWHPQQVFDQLEGVSGTWVGYTGGTKENPTYEEVCQANTGHAEVVHMEFEPRVVTYETLLDIFWQIHDPTQLDGQGDDIGSQYRSAIFTHDEYQARVARESKTEKGTSGRWLRPIITTIQPAPTFWEAEDYHQKYMERLDHRSWMSDLFIKRKKK
ncbi:MAG: peptide-methionine (S)-S-oxide reductase [Alphaproteobacteria bacterium]|nr:peptide-methionine (S)-S-oxide reductase [Alphaproteobacteria bacterium]HCP01769.1 peptide-methionine (S)-S-oxide reductase [Rhodospirillaceae bacterium]